MKPNNDSNTEEGYIITDISATVLQETIGENDLSKTKHQQSFLDRLAKLLNM